MSADGEKGGVIQADRNFTADYLMANGQINHIDHDRICQGIWDDTRQLREIAAFRLMHAAPATDTPEVVRLREALEKIAATSFTKAGSAYDMVRIARSVLPPFALAKHPTSPEDAA